VKRKKAFQARNNRLQDDFQALASYDLHEKQLVSGLGLVNTMTQTTLLGKRLHKRRTEQGLSLRALAEKTDLTASFLSQLERGITNASLNSLQKIAEALGVPLLYFLSDTTRHSPVVRADNRPKIELEDRKAAYELLTPGLTGRFEALIRTLKPGGEVHARNLNIETEQMVFILNGGLKIFLKTGEHILNTGDSIYFNGNDLIKLQCHGDEDVSWIFVITPPVF
jgi:transcriptional regulator with XRE-family HTH domain